MRSTDSWKINELQVRTVRVYRKNTGVFFIYSHYYHTQNIDPRCIGLFPHWPIFQDQLGVLQFNPILTLSSWMYLDTIYQIWQGKGSGPKDCSPLPMPMASSRYPDYPHLVWRGYKLEVNTTPSSESITC